LIDRYKIIFLIKYKCVIVLITRYLISIIFIYVLFAYFPNLWEICLSFFEHFIFVTFLPFHFALIQLIGQQEYFNLMMETADINFLYLFGFIFISGLVYKRDIFLKPLINIFFNHYSIIKNELYFLFPFSTWYKTFKKTISSFWDFFNKF